MDIKNISIIIGVIILLLLTLVIIDKGRAVAVRRAVDKVKELNTSAHQKESFAAATATIETPAHSAFKMDVFKQIDIYDNFNLTNAQKYPSQAAANMLMSQQNDRQYMLSVLTEKYNIATVNTASSVDEVNKAQNRLTLARNHEEKARKDKEKAELALAQAVIMQTYTASNAVSIDPAVIAKTAAALATAIAIVTMATDGFEKAKNWYQTMQQETSQFSSELDMYKAKGVTAASEQMIALKNLNEVKTFYNMSGEAEFIHKRFFPFGTKDSSANKLQCDLLAPAAGDKVK